MVIFPGSQRPNYHICSLSKFKAPSFWISCVEMDDGEKTGFYRFSEQYLNVCDAMDWQLAIRLCFMLMEHGLNDNQWKVVTAADHVPILYRRGGEDYESDCLSQCICNQLHINWKEPRWKRKESDYEKLCRFMCLVMKRIKWGRELMDKRNGGAEVQLVVIECI